MPKRKVEKLEQLYPSLKGTRAIPYRPVLQALTGDLPSAILLNQILHYWHVMGGRTFWKFQVPSSHPRYRPGDSWTEELGLSQRVFSRALQRIATRKRYREIDDVLLEHQPKFGPISDKRFAEPSRQVLLNAKSLVVYWVDIGHLTRFRVNDELLTNALKTVAPAYLLEHTYRRKPKPHKVD